MNYCSNCGSGKVSREIPTGDNLFRFCCPDCGTIHYHNPKIIVGCIPVYNNKILLCKRAIPPRYGYWNLPAGYLENGETTEEGAMRETYEEACAEVEIERLHTLYNLPHVNQVYLHFLAHMKSGNYACGQESLDVGLFSLDEIPWEHIAFSSTSFALAKFIEFQHSNFEGVHMGTFSKKV